MPQILLSLAFPGLLHLRPFRTNRAKFGRAFFTVSNRKASTRQTIPENSNHLISLIPIGISRIADEPIPGPGPAWSGSRGGQPLVGSGVKPRQDGRFRRNAKGLAAPGRDCQNARALFLAPTDRHVEIALAMPGGSRRGARTLRAFVQGALAMMEPDLGWATNAMTRLVVRAALEAESIPGVTLPEEPAERVAFANVVDSAIGALRRSGCRPDHLFQAEGSEATLLGEVMRRADGILTARSLVDPRGGGFVLSRALRRSPCDALLEGLSAYEIKVSGILGLEADDLAWLEALHGRAREAGGSGLVVELPRLAGSTLFATVEGDEEGNVDVCTLVERRWAEMSLGPTIDWTTLSEAPARRVLRAGGPDGEARGVAAEVLAALGSGLPPETIAIVVPSLDDETLDPFRAALGDARIPFHEPRGPSPDASPEGRAVLSLLALAAGPIARERVIDLLRAPGLHAGHWVLERHERDAEAKAALPAHSPGDLPGRKSVR